MTRTIHTISGPLVVLDIFAPRARAGSPAIVECVRRLLLSEPGRRWRVIDLVRAVERIRGVTVSDSGVTAKLRDLRKPAWGSLDVRSKREHGSTWTYWIEVGR